MNGNSFRSTLYEAVAPFINNIAVKSPNGS